MDWNQHPKGLLASEVINGIIIESTLELEGVAVLDRLKDSGGPLKAIFLDSSSFMHHHSPLLEATGLELSLASLE